jgi:ABC-2 type transport system permease protein
VQSVALEFSRIGFLNMLAFRLRYYAGIVSYLIYVTVYYFIWRAVFAVDPHFAGFTLSQMITYVGVGWIIRSMYFNNLDTEMAEDILDGRMTMTMVKPVSVQMSYVARAMGESAFRLLMLTVPATVAIGLIFPVQAPASLAHFAAFVVSLAGSVLLVAAINFVVGSCAVRLTSILGLLRAKFWVQDLLSGVLVPLTLLPAPLRAVSHWLPFEHIGFTPLMIYLGKLSWASIGRALAAEALWIAFLLWFGAWFWRVMSRKITIHGG